MRVEHTEKTTRIFLIRHAEADGTVRNDRARPLTEKGRRDAERLADALGDTRFDYLYTSPYKRAIETMMPLARAQGIGIEVIGDFRERRSADYWVEDFDAFMERQWADFSYRLPGGESLSEVRERCMRVLMAMCRKISGKTAAVATHGTALAVILNSVDPSFGYRSFLEILPLTPFVVMLELRGETFLRWEHVRLSQNDIEWAEEATI